MPIAMTPEQQALQASLRDWAKRANPIAMVRALEPRDGSPPNGVPPGESGEVASRDGHALKGRLEQRSESRRVKFEGTSSIAPQLKLSQPTSIGISNTH